MILLIDASRRMTFIDLTFDRDIDQWTDPSLTYAFFEAVDENHSSIKFSTGDDTEQNLNKKTQRLDDEINLPAIVPNTSKVIDCFSLNGSKLLLLLDSSCIVYNRQFQMLETYDFKFPLHCCRPSIDNKREEFWLVFRQPSNLDRQQDNVIYDAGEGESDTLIKYYTFDEQSHSMQSGESMILTNTSVVNIFEYASKQIAVVTDKSELIIFKFGKVINKLKCPTSTESEYASVVSLPGFETQWFPFLAWNINGRVYIVHLTSSKITELI